MTTTQILAGIGFIILAAFAVITVTQNEELAGMGSLSIADPEIQGGDAVGIIFSDAKQATQILSQFTFVDVPCDSEATSSDCMVQEVRYKDKPVRVYAVYPQSITTEFSAAVGSFPFSGQLEYKNLGEAEVDLRVIKVMQEQGNAKFDVLYEKK